MTGCDVLEILTVWSLLGLGFILILHCTRQ